MPTSCTNISETAAIFKGIKRTLELCSSTESLGEETNRPTHVIKDKQVTIVHIKKYSLTPRIKQIDTILTWLRYHYIIGNFFFLLLSTKWTWRSIYIKEKLFKVIFFTSWVWRYIFDRIQNNTNYWNSKNIILVNTGYHFLSNLLQRFFRLPLTALRLVISLYLFKSLAFSFCSFQKSLTRQTYT